MQELLCQTNSPEIAQEYLTKDLENRPAETKQFFCDDKSIKECANNYRKTCPSPVAKAATDTVCSDVMSDIAMIQGSCRVLSFLLAGTFTFYFAKNLFRSKKTPESAPLKPIADDPKTTPMKTITASTEPVSVTKELKENPSKKTPSLMLDELFSYPNLDEDLIKNLQEKVKCQQ